jgi:hypothetical protein
MVQSRIAKLVDRPTRPPVVLRRKHHFMASAVAAEVTLSVGPASLCPEICGEVLFDVFRLYRQYFSCRIMSLGKLCIRACHLEIIRQFGSPPY